MITYKEFRPTPYDRHLYIDEDREDWLVTRFIQTRDSGARRTAWDCNNNAGDAVYELIER